VSIDARLLYLQRGGLMRKPLPVKVCQQLPGVNRSPDAYANPGADNCKQYRYVDDCHDARQSKNLFRAVRSGGEHYKGMPTRLSSTTGGVNHVVDNR
jgi:hypothetical protein